MQHLLSNFQICENWSVWLFRTAFKQVSLIIVNDLLVPFYFCDYVLETQKLLHICIVVKTPPWFIRIFFNWWHNKTAITNSIAINSEFTKMYILLMVLNKELYFLTCMLSYIMQLVFCDAFNVAICLVFHWDKHVYCIIMLWFFFFHNKLFSL